MALDWARELRGLT